MTKDSISALVEGIHFDSKGNITNIDTSGLVTTDDFNVLLSKKVNFDSGGHITNISTSGLVTEAGFAQMFSERAEDGGYVKRAEISTFITEDDAGRLISNATISADQIRFNGNIVANDTFVVDTEGNLTLNNITANNLTANSGVFKGDIIQGDGINRMNADGSVSFANGKISWGMNGSPIIEGKIVTSFAGKRIEVDPETSSIRLFDSADIEVGYINFSEDVSASGWLTTYPEIYLKRTATLNNVSVVYDEINITPGQIRILNRMDESNIQSLSLIPGVGLMFSTNDVLKKVYPAT